MKHIILLFSSLFIFSRGSAQIVGADSTLKNLSYEKFQSWLQSKDKLVLVHFKADWCVVCKREKPVLELIQAENKSTLLVQELDLDEHPQLGLHYEIDALPVHMLFKHGVLIWSKVGMLDKKEFEEVLKVGLKK